VEGAAGGELGRLDAGEGLPIDAERIEADGEEAEATRRRDDDAKGLAIDLYGDGTAASGL
jgi:hypothetical protein